MEAIIKAHNVQNIYWLTQGIKTFSFQKTDVDEQSWCYWCPQRQVLTLPEVTRHSVGNFFINKQDIFKGMYFFLEGLSSIECVVLYITGKSCWKIQVNLNVKQNCIISDVPKLENTCLCIQWKPSAPLAPSMAEINIWCGWVLQAIKWDSLTLVQGWPREHVLYIKCTCCVTVIRKTEK